MKILFLDFSTGLKALSDLDGPRRGLTNSLLKVPDALSKLNNEVQVFSEEVKGKTDSGTTWVSMWDFFARRERERTEYDFLILNRGIGNLYPEIRAKHRILWTHDLPHSGFAEDPDNLKALRATVFMSRYGEQVWRTHFPQIGRSFLIPNGVDRSIFKPEQKDLNYLLYAFHPIRGLRRLPLIFGAVREAVNRPLYLKVFSSFYANEYQTGDHMDHYPLNQDEEFPEGMTVQPAIPQEEIAREMGKAGLVLMPTGYPEICSNSILQCLACGTPIVATGNLGSAGEWIKHGKNGWLTKFTPADYMTHQVEIMRGAVSILKDEKLHRKMCGNAAKTPGIYDWSEIGAMWNKMLRSLL